MAKQYQGSFEITSQVIIPFRVSLAKHHSVFALLLTTYSPWVTVNFLTMSQSVRIFNFFH